MRLLLALLVGVLLNVSTAAANYSLAEASFMSHSVQERVSIQMELTWTGDYNAMVDAEFGPRTYSAIQAFQRRNGFPVTGMFTQPQRKILWADVSEILDKIGYETVKDQRANVELVVPTNLAPDSTPTRRGTRWTSPSSDFVLESLFVPVSEASFEHLYNRLRAERDRQRVHYSTIRDDLFVVSGTRSGNPFYIRFHRIPTGSRGIAISWAPGLLANMEGVVLGLANSVFDISDSLAPRTPSIPEADPSWVMVGSFRSRVAAEELARQLAGGPGESSEVPVSVVLTDSGLFAVALGPVPRQVGDRVVTALREDGIVSDAWLSSGHGFVSQLWKSGPDDMPPAARRPSGGGLSQPDRVATGTGFFINPYGLMLTNAHVVAECREIEIPNHGAAKVLRKDEQNDLAVVQVAVVEATPHATFQSKPTRVQSDVVVLGYPLAHILGGALNTTSGHVSSLSGLNGDSRFIQVTAPVQPGNSGGPVLDMDGRVVGIATARISDSAVLQEFGALPQNINFAIRKEAMTAFLSAANVNYHTDSSDERLDRSDIAELGAEFTRAIICTQ